MVHILGSRPPEDIITLEGHFSQPLLKSISAGIWDLLLFSFIRWICYKEFGLFCDKFTVKGTKLFGFSNELAEVIRVARVALLYDLHEAWHFLVTLQNEQYFHLRLLTMQQNGTVHF